MLSEKRVLVQGINYAPERTGMGKYTAGMVDYMVKKGIECTVITSFPFHPEWKVGSPYKNRFYKKEVFDNGRLTIYRCPMYIPSNPTGLTRIIQEASFVITSSIILLKLMFKSKFDAFIIISPPFHLGIVALFYRTFRKTRIIYHIQDLQIDLAKQLSLIKNQWVIKCMFRIESFILGRVDYVSTISEGMIRKIKLKRDINVVSFPNWVDTEMFFPIENNLLTRQKWNFLDTDHIVLYSGNIGEKQGLETILDVAYKFKNMPRVKFIICGNGAYKIRLLDQARKTNIPNLHFIPLQPEEDFNNFLNIADVHLIIQKEDASDLVMPSKLTTILAVGGRVIATAKPQTTLYNVIMNNDIGVVVSPEDPEQLYYAILESTKNIKRIAEKSRKYALENLSIEEIMKSFLDEINLRPC